MIAGETQRTSHLVNQLLTLARAEPGETPGGQPVNLHEIVGRDVRDWVQRALGKNIDLGFELEDAWTLGEPLLLRELAANLLDNALAYTQAGGSVTLRTAVRNGESVLEVEDDGPGIPEAEREKVFGRFYRVAATGAKAAGWACRSSRRSPGGTTPGRPKQPWRPGNPDPRDFSAVGGAGRALARAVSTRIPTSR
jgi:signal transduction histidine kinase